MGGAKGKRKDVRIILEGLVKGEVGNKMPLPVYTHRERRGKKEG